MAFYSQATARSFAAPDYFWEAARSGELSKEEIGAVMTIASTFTESPVPSEEDMEHNDICVDWFSFTLPWCNDPRFIIREVLKMNPDLFIEAPWRVQEGYDCGLVFANVVVAFAPYRKNVTGCYVRMTGQGCRTFEAYTSFEHPFNDLMTFLTSSNMHGVRVLLDGEGDAVSFVRFMQLDELQLVSSVSSVVVPVGNFCKITRCDVAFDDFEGLLDINTIADAVQNRYYVSKAKNHSVISSLAKGRFGKTCYIGSKSSYLGFIRIYDKAAEMLLSKDTHWVRVEVQLRHHEAQSFVTNVGLGSLVGDVAVALLRDRLDFLDPDDIQYEYIQGQANNFSSNARAAWWAAFLDSFIKEIKIYFRTYKRPPASLEKTASWICKQVKPSFNALVARYGMRYIRRLLDGGGGFITPRLRCLLESSDGFCSTLLADVTAALDLVLEMFPELSGSSSDGVFSLASA